MFCENKMEKVPQTTVCRILDFFLFISQATLTYRGGSSDRLIPLCNQDPLQQFFLSDFPKKQARLHVLLGAGVNYKTDMQVYMNIC